MTLPDGLRREGIIESDQAEEVEMVSPSSSVSMMYRMSEWSTAGAASYTGISAISTGG